MTLDVTRDLLTKLRSDVSVTQFLSSYQGQEAIFATVPEDAPDAFVYIKAPHSVADRSSKNGDRYSEEQFIDIVTAHRREYHEYNTQTVETISNAIRRLLHRATITAYGSVQIEIAEALGPIEADGEDYFGRIVQCRLIVREIS